jgi:hypothetical protein
MSGKFFEMTSPPLPRRQYFLGKFLRCPFSFEKCPSKHVPPQLLDPSYAPVPAVSAVAWFNLPNIVSFSDCVRRFLLW